LPLSTWARAECVPSSRLRIVAPCHNSSRPAKLSFLEPRQAVRAETTESCRRLDKRPVARVVNPEAGRATPLQPPPSASHASVFPRATTLPDQYKQIPVSDRKLTILPLLLTSARHFLRSHRPCRAKEPAGPVCGLPFAANRYLKGQVVIGTASSQRELQACPMSTKNPMRGHDDGGGSVQARMW